MYLVVDVRLKGSRIEVSEKLRPVSLGESYPATFFEWCYAALEKLHATGNSCNRVAIEEQIFAL